MLFCCHKYFYKTEIRALKDTLTRTNQLLEIGFCPKCNTKRVEYNYYLNGKRQRPLKLKGKKADKLLDELRNQPYLEIKDLKERQGTKNNMFWLYQTNGLIKDFNNVTKGSCKTDLTSVNIKTVISAPIYEGAFL